MKRLILRMLVVALAGCGDGTSTSTSTQTLDTARTTRASKDIEAVPGEMIVKLNESVPKSSGKAVSKSLGMPVLEHFEELGISRIQVPTDATVEDIKQMYGDKADFVEPNFIIRSQAITPNDQLYADYQWNMRKIGMPVAWGVSQGSSNIVIGIIDTGILSTHPDLAPNWSGYFKNATGVQQTPFDDNGHGTEVAGVVAARGNNGGGVAGVNWNTKIAACKALDAAGSGTTSSAIACVDYFNSLRAQGVNIVAVNESWGSGGISQSLQTAIAANVNILHVAAAGNIASNNDVSPTYPASFKLPNIISVAATSTTDTLSAYSSYGRRTTSMAAPGDGIATTSLGNGYVLAQGTSLAVPHVTGAIGLVAASKPTLTAPAIRNLVMSSGDTLPALATTTVSGKRLNVGTAMACTSSPIFSLLSVPTGLINGALTYTVISVNCSSPVGPITANVNGQSYTVQNTDGIATFTYTPTVALNNITFSSAAGSESTSITVPITTSAPLAAIGTVIPIIKGANTSVQAVTGGQAPYNIIGTLPAGLSISTTGLVTGKSTIVGIRTAAIKITDAKNVVLSKTLIFNTVLDAPLASTVLPTFTKGVAVSLQLTPSGITGPYVFTGTLPVGLKMSTTGLISGIPTTISTGKATLTTRDSYNDIATKVAAYTVK